MTPPDTDNPNESVKWLFARRRVIRHLLAVVSVLPQVNHLVLRGSLLMPAWFGDLAREPGDMDWLVIPPTVEGDDAWGQALFRDLLRACNDYIPSAVGLLMEEGRIENIWEYDSAPGKRLTFPWRVDDLPISTFHMDFVFGETLQTSPELIAIAEPWGDGTKVLSASPEESLAWKIQWLLADDAPNGKDLYDAVLLAESVELSGEVLNAVLPPSLRNYLPSTSEDLYLEDVAWEEFSREHPRIEGTLQEWSDRLRAALADTFAALPVEDKKRGKPAPLVPRIDRVESAPTLPERRLSFGSHAVAIEPLPVFSLPTGQRRKKGEGDNHPRRES